MILLHVRSLGLGAHSHNSNCQMSTEKDHLSYINNVLIKEIEEKLRPDKLLEFEVEHSTGLDGFMSALYTINMKVSDERNKKETSRRLLAKFMKGDEHFRVSSRCYIQFANEILIYSKVIPYYEKVLSEAAAQSTKAECWIPKVYAAKYGKIDGLNSDGTTSNESVLVLEHLKEKGYAMGPRLYLDKPHMLAMVKPLAEYHAMTYALRIKKDKHLEELIKSIVPLPFVETADSTKNFYDPIYKVAFDRFFDYFNRCKKNLISKDNSHDIQLENNINRLYTKYGKTPTKLLEFIRTIHNENDKKYAAILHGDFNRNNVMFKYEGDDSNPKDCKLIDFQELRFGTPCIDLSFAMFMNMERSIRHEFWMDLLKFYHKTLFNTMSEVLKPNDETTKNLLESYSFDDFNNHFTKYAFYGVMICMHFLPWLCGTEEELSLLSQEFERDVHGELFYSTSFAAGGDDANNRIFEIFKHASIMGYMNVI
ncbi:uncharacterized protein LOC129940178 isoform X2 [Eupeodes corollae]|uniref:uncharacterized protein LOC129940178 isoform X2 n=1 Tax=Eupeodes corollae TaxID=290404 RepID=UPI0024927AB0|nr:uncharacterized protein LOC129940178 isoform X2 [Eupeodes corollae]